MAAAELRARGVEPEITVVTARARAAVGVRPAGRRRASRSCSPSAASRLRTGARVAARDGRARRSTDGAAVRADARDRAAAPASGPAVAGPAARRARVHPRRRARPRRRASRTSTPPATPRRSRSSRAASPPSRPTPPPRRSPPSSALADRAGAVPARHARAAADRRRAAVPALELSSRASRASSGPTAPPPRGDGLAARAVVAAGQDRRPLPRAVAGHRPPAAAQRRAAAGPHAPRRRAGGRPRRRARARARCSPSRTRSSATTRRRCTRSTRRRRSTGGVLPAEWAERRDAWMAARVAHV